VKPEEVEPVGIDTVRLGGTTLVTVDSLVEWARRALEVDSGPEGNAVKAELLAAFEAMR
jgi:hypothetical protein